MSTHCRDLEEDELAAEDDEEVARCMSGAGAGEEVVVVGREGVRAVDHRNNGVKSGGGR